MDTRGPATSHERAPLRSSPAVTLQNNQTNGREMLTASQVHELTGIPVSTLHDWAARRERGIDTPGPHHIRLSGRHRRWARVDVNEWIQSARV
jgi:predicted DNA-binding transcriptional regulator AlpA